MRLIGPIIFGAAIAGAAAAAAAGAPAPPEAPVIVTLTLKDHRFSPGSITVPAGRKIVIDLINQDMATEEFDSEDLKVEVMVTPGGRKRFVVGPLSPGAHHFMGELHPDTAQGVLIVEAAP